MFRIADRQVLKHAFASSVPVLMGYLAMGFAAGVMLAMQSGVRFPVFWGALTAGSCISGTMQFMFPGWFKNGISLLDAALITLCINFRYATYGFSLLNKFQGLKFRKKLYLIWSLTDETYALECSAPYRGSRFIHYAMLLAGMNHLYWVLGVTAGAAIGSHLPFSGKGIDFAMTALFLVILTDQCREKVNRRPALVGGLAALAGLMLFGADRMLIPSIILLFTVFLVFRRKWDRGESEK